MSKNNIRSYILEQVEKGTSKDAIFKNLQKAGWNTVDIQIAFSKAVEDQSRHASAQASAHPGSLAMKDTSGDGEATASLILGIFAVFFMLFPVFALVGIVLGILALKKTLTQSHHAKAVWGIALSSFSLVFGMLFWIIIIIFAVNEETQFPATRDHIYPSALEQGDEYDYSGDNDSINTGGAYNRGR